MRLLLIVLLSGCCANKVNELEKRISVIEKLNTEPEMERHLYEPGYVPPRPSYMMMGDDKLIYWTWRKE